MTAMLEFVEYLRLCASYVEMVRTTDPEYDDWRHAGRVVYELAVDLDGTTQPLRDAAERRGLRALAT